MSRLRDHLASVTFNSAMVDIYPHTLISTKLDRRGLRHQPGLSNRRIPHVYPKRQIQLVRTYDQRYQSRWQVLFRCGRLDHQRNARRRCARTPPSTLAMSDIAGMLNIPGHTAWVGYISVDDVDAHIEKIVDAGGKLWKPATDVPGMLRFAVMSDPQGAAIVVFTPNPAMPSPVRPSTTNAWNHRLARALHNRRRSWIRFLQQALRLDQGQRYGYGTDGCLSHL